MIRVQGINLAINGQSHDSANGPFFKGGEGKGMNNMILWKNGDETSANAENQLLPPNFNNLTLEMQQNPTFDSHHTKGRTLKLTEANI